MFLLNLFYSISTKIKRNAGSEPRTFSSGCNDAFSVFGFLAFLLALLDLIMELNMMAAGRKRRKRFSTPDFLTEGYKAIEDWTNIYDDNDGGGWEANKDYSDEDSGQDDDGNGSNNMVHSRKNVRWIYVSNNCTQW